jgi:hypothetical protein
MHRMNARTQEERWRVSHSHSHRNLKKRPARVGKRHGARAQFLLCFDASDPDQMELD